MTKDLTGKLEFSRLPQPGYLNAEAGCRLVHEGNWRFNRWMHGACVIWEIKQIFEEDSYLARELRRTPSVLIF